MSKGQHTFKQGDVTKALKAAQRAGVSVRRVEIDREGKIIIVTGRPDQVSVVAETEDAREWD